MLGRLARWLRLLGFDTLYYPDISDSRVLQLALQDERIILTRDTHFTKIKNLRNLLLLRSENPLQQVVEVARAFNLKGFMPGRCARCNGILDTVDHKESVRNLAPEYVYLNCNNFLRCKTCGNIYWEGTHIRRFRSMLSGIAKDNEIC